jgi:hypothetical protein
LESESEGGAGIHFPHTPFSSRHARAEKFSAMPREARQSKFSVRIFVKKSSDFVQKAPPSKLRGKNAGNLREKLES